MFNCTIIFIEMGIAIVGIGTNQKKEQAGAPFAPTSAHDGTSIDGSGKIALGNTPGDLAAPAALLDDREIQTNDSLGTIFGLTLADNFNLIKTTLNGDSVVVQGQDSTTPSLTISGGRLSTASLSVTTGNLGIATLTVAAPQGNATISAQSSGGGRADLEVNSSPDKLTIRSLGNGFIDFILQNVLPFLRVNTSTINSQFTGGGSGAAANGATVQITGTITKRLKTDDRSPGGYTLNINNDNSKVFSNQNGASNLILPNMVGSNFREGFYFDVNVTTAAGISIDASVQLVRIRFGGGSSVGGNISSVTVGSFLRIMVVDSSTWVVCFFTGTWVLV